MQDAADTIIRNRQQFFQSEADTAIVRKMNNLQRLIDDLRASEKKQRTRAERAEQLRMAHVAPTEPHEMSMAEAMDYMDDQNASAKVRG